MFEQLISFQARYRPDAAAIWTPSGVATFASLDDDVHKMAYRLKPIVPSGGRTAVQVESIGLHWVILLALARLGCVSASLPHVGERPEADLLAILLPDFLLTDRDMRDLPIEGFRLTPEWITATFQTAPRPFAPHVFAPDDPVRLVLSSGTTGRPKKMLFTRSMVDARVKTGGLSQMAHRRLHAAVGIDTETGFRAALVAWATGQPVAYPQAGFKWANFLTESKVEALVVVPAQLNMILSSLPAGFGPLANLSIIVVSGAVPRPLYDRARQHLTAEVFVTYGSTEAGLACQASPRLLQQAEELTGIVSPSAEVEIVDSAGVGLPFGASGRIRVRTQEMVSGYLDDDALTQEFFNSGWFYPGDLGSLNATGQLTVQGRETEILDLGGLRIAPSVIEDMILACPGVLDAAAYKVMNAEGGEGAAAAIVCGPGCDLGFIRSRLDDGLPQFEIVLTAVAEIPRSARGKIERDVLQGHYEGTTPV